MVAAGRGWIFWGLAMVAKAGLIGLYAKGTLFILLIGRVMADRHSIRIYKAK
jgi:hypothetical protein